MTRRKSAYQSFKRKMAPTASDIEGPFYKAGAPARLELSKSPNLTVEVRVYDTDANIVRGATVEFWQADAGGSYDNAGYSYRGKWTTTEDPFVIKTIMPGDYDISDPTDPEPHEYRCAHLHFMITAPGYKKLTTQLYFPDDKYNLTDHWFDDRRVIQHPVGKFDFVIEEEMQ